MKHKHPHPKNELFAALFRTGFKEYRKDLIVDAALHYDSEDVLKKIKLYMAWLDDLGVSSIMLLSEYSIDLLCLLYASVLTNRTILILPSFLSSNMIKHEFNRLNVELLIFDKFYGLKRQGKYFENLLFEPKANFLYCRNSQIGKFCFLPGLLFYTNNNFHRKKICHFHYQVVANKLYQCIQDFKFTSKDVFLINEHNEIFSWLCSIFLPLCLGAKLVISKISNQHNIPDLISLIRRSRISVLFCSPILFSEFQSRVIGKKLGADVVSLQKIFLFGSRPRFYDLKQWFSFVQPNTFICHLFTETEYLFPFYKLISKHTPEAEYNHIGKVSIDSDYALVKYQDNLYELFVSGTLCSGYVDLLTSLQHFAIENGKRFFKTGKLIFVKEDNLFLYADKARIISKNNQLINLDEIEQTFNQFSVMGKCAVISDLKDHIYLFIEGYNNAEDLLQLKKYLRQKLPNHVNVDSFEFMAKLPRTTLGEVDYYNLQIDVSSYFRKYFIAGKVDKNYSISNLNLSEIDYINLSEYVMVRTGKFLDVHFNLSEFPIKDISKHLYKMPLPLISSAAKVEISPFHLSKYVNPFLKTGSDEGGIIFRLPLLNHLSLYKLKLAIISTIKNHFMLSCRVVKQSEVYYFVRVKPNEEIIFKSKGRRRNIPLSNEQLKIGINDPQLVKIYLEQVQNNKTLIISYHQIALDDWSLNQFLFEVFARYQDQFINELPNLRYQAFYLTRIGQLLPSSKIDLTLLLDMFDKYPHINTQPLIPIFSRVAPVFTSILVISKAHIEAFKTRHKIMHGSDSSVFLFIMYLSLSRALSMDALIIHISLLNRVGPCYFNSRLLSNSLTELPLLILPSSEIKHQIAYLNMVMSLYFHHMDFDTVLKFYQEIQSKSWMKEYLSDDYQLVFSFVPSTHEKAKFQSQLVDWSKVESHVTNEGKGRILFRVCEMDQQFIVHLDTKVLGGIHSNILGHLKDIFHKKI